MSAVLRIGLFGLGTMGRNHARLLSTNPAVEFVAVADADASALARTGLRHLPCYGTHDELMATE